MQQQQSVVDTLATPPSEPRPLILVAEDDGPVRELLSRLLRTAAHAMKLAAILRFDAAVIDLAMPTRAAGIGLLSWLRAYRHFGQLPVLILTGLVDLSEATQASIRDGHAYVFYKGHSLNALVDHLTRRTAAIRLPAGNLLPSAIWWSPGGRVDH
jgi:CheY-like chemotaxis protein